MKLAALFSGGKDSVYAAYLAQKQGHTITHLVTILPENKDSYMYHSVNIPLTTLQAEALRIPHILKESSGGKESEISDLKEILSTLDIDGVVSGAVASDYQYSRIQSICDALNLKTVSPLWHTDQEQVVTDQINAGFTILIVGVFAEGLNQSWLGRTLDHQALEDLKTLHKKYRINIAGEGGEYETLVVDGPCFHKTLVIEEAETHWTRDSGRYLVRKAHLCAH